jgi:hypothetical protein
VIPFLAFVSLLAATPQDLPVEKTKNNIKVLQGLPSSQLIPTMAFMANSLGVTCNECHTKEWESDEKPSKDAARKMIVLQRSINQQHYGGKTVVTCNTCHQGHVVPPAVPDLADAGWTARTVLPPENFISGENAVLQLWPAGGPPQRIVRGVVERNSGRDEPKSAEFTLTLGTSIDYKTELSHPPEARRAFALFAVSRPLPEQVANERWTITPERVTRHREITTPLGTLPEEITYEDFRQTPSGRLPFRTRWSRADYRVTFTIATIE